MSGILPKGAIGILEGRQCGKREALARATESMLERSVESRLTRRCREEGILCLKIQGAKGWPDRLLIHEGRYLFVEMKRPVGGRLSPMQVEVMGQLTDQGARWMVAKGDGDIETAIGIMTGLPVYPGLSPKPK